MSKKSRNRRHRRTFPWAYVVLGGVFVLAAIFLFTNKGSAYSGGTPVTTVDQERIDLGYIQLGGYRSFKIKVTNTGDGVLRFKETPYIEVLEGCCPPELNVAQMTLGPGESTYVESPDFMMHEGMDGKHDFGVHLKTNDPINPDLVVHVLSDWGL